MDIYIDPCWDLLGDKLGNFEPIYKKCELGLDCFETGYFYPVDDNVTQPRTLGDALYLRVNILSRGVNSLTTYKSGTFCATNFFCTATWAMPTHTRIRGIRASNWAAPTNLKFVRFVLPLRIVCRNLRGYTIITNLKFEFN